MSSRLDLRGLSVENRVTDLALVAPWFQVRLEKALSDSRLSGLGLNVFESFRTPERQDFLYAQGRTTPGRKVTSARAWRSYHQYGVAADVVFYKDRKWSWEGPWDLVHEVFESYGFETLDFEKPHVQITASITIDDMQRIYKTSGIITLWEIMERRLKAYESLNA